MAKPEGERVATLEAQMENIKKQVEDGFHSVNLRLDKLSESLDTRYATKDELANVRNIAEKKPWIWTLISVTITGIVVFLLDYFLRDISKVF